MMRGAAGWGRDGLATTLGCRGGLGARGRWARSVAGWSGSLMATAIAPPIARTTTVRVTKNVDTSDSMLPGGPTPTDRGVPTWNPPPEWPAPPPSAAAPEPARPRRARVVTIISIAISSVLVAAGLGAGIVRIPYDTIGPGEAKVANDVVTVRGHEVFKPAGKLLSTTVSVRERVSVLQAVLGWLDPTTDVVAEQN